MARDSVALNNLKDFLKPVRESLEDDNPEKKQQDLRRFWLIVGLIEIGEVTKAEELIKKFDPEDNRLLLGIHLGCFLLQHTRVSSGQQKKSALRVCELVSEHITQLRGKLLAEFKSELLEMRQDDIKALGSPDNKDVLPINGESSNA